MRGLMFGAVFMMAFAAGGAYAAEEKVAPVMGENPYKEKIEKMTDELAASLSKEEQATVTQLMSSFGIVRAVRLTRDQVDEAAAACAKENPDMKEAMDKRYATWQKAIDPELEKNEKALELTLKNKKLFKEPTKIKEYTTLFDKSAEYAIAQVQQEMITTPESCKGLMTSFDNTQETLSGFLKDLEWPIPVESADKPAKEEKSKVEETAEKPVEEKSEPVVEEKTPEAEGEEVLEKSDGVKAE